MLHLTSTRVHKFSVVYQTKKKEKENEGWKESEVSVEGPGWKVRSEEL